MKIPGRLTRRNFRNFLKKQNQELVADSESGSFETKSKNSEKSRVSKTKKKRKKKRVGKKVLKKKVCRGSRKGVKKKIKKEKQKVKSPRGNGGKENVILKERKRDGLLFSAEDLIVNFDGKAENSANLKENSVSQKHLQSVCNFIFRKSRD